MRCVYPLGTTTFNQRCAPAGSIKINANRIEAFLPRYTVFTSRLTIFHSASCNKANVSVRLIQHVELYFMTRGQHAASYLTSRHSFLSGSALICPSIKRPWVEPRRSMSSKPHRSRTSSVSSITSFATTPDQLSMVDITPSSNATPEPHGVGLSDPAQSEYRRKILEVVDRMRATG